MNHPVPVPWLTLCHNTHFPAEGSCSHLCVCPNGTTSLSFPIACLLSTSCTCVLQMNPELSQCLRVCFWGPKLRHPSARSATCSSRAGTVLLSPSVILGASSPPSFCLCPHVFSCRPWDSATLELPKALLLPFPNAFCWLSLFVLARVPTARETIQVTETKRCTLQKEWELIRHYY